MAKSVIGAGFWHERPKSLLLWCAALICAGGWAALHLPLEWVPSIELPSVVVRTSWPSASPLAVERYVTAPIERALQGIEGTSNLESVSRRGQSIIRFESLRGDTIDLQLEDISARLAIVRKLLPEGVVPRLERESPTELTDEQGFMTLQLIGRADLDGLRHLARSTLAPRLRSLPGIAGLMIEGGRERELRITVDDEALQAHSVALSDLHHSIVRVLEPVDYGGFDGARAALVYDPGTISLATLGGLPLMSKPASGTQEKDRLGSLLRLDDVATLSMADAPRTSIRRIDGQPAVTLTLSRAPGSHLLEVARRVRQHLEQIRSELPPDTTILVADDFSERVLNQLVDLAVRGGSGCLGLVLVLFFMLKSGRSVGLVLFSVVLSLSLALALMKPLGLTLNLLTLAGLVLLVGLLVDNAVVVIESLLARGKKSIDSVSRIHIGRALRGVLVPLLGGTMTTMAVLLPVIYLSGELRALFLPLALLIALALGASLLVSLVVIPVLWPTLAPHSETSRGWRAWVRRFEWILAWVSRHPGTSLAVLVLLLGLPTPFLPELIDEPAGGFTSRRDRGIAERYNSTLGSDAVRTWRQTLDPLLGGVLRPFLTDVELGRRWRFDPRPELYVRLSLPVGSGLERADELIRGFESMALRSPARRRIFTLVGADHAFLRVQFEEASMATPVPLRLRQALIQHALQFAGMEISIWGLVPVGFYGGAGEVSSYLVKASGPSYEGLLKEAQAFAERLRRIPRVASVDVQAGRYWQERAQDTLRLVWSADDVAQTGLYPRQLAEVLRPHLLSSRPFAFLDSGEATIPVRLEMANGAAHDLAQVLGRPLRRAVDNAFVFRAKELVSPIIEPQPASIERSNQRYRRYLRVFYRGPYRLGQEMLEAELAEHHPSMGYRLEAPSSTFFEAKIEREFLWTILATTVLVYLITAMVFESWFLPMVMLASLPLAFIGVALGFLLTGAEFSEGAFIGLVLLTGIAVNDSILLIDRFRKLGIRRPKLAAELLARLAVRQRFRPMWATTLTSIVAMIPLLIAPDPGFWFGLAVVVVGGLLSSSLLVPPATVAVLSLGYREDSFLNVT